MHIRPATPADIPQMISIERQSPTAGHWTAEQYQQALQELGPKRLMLVAEDFTNPDYSREEKSNSALVGFLVSQQVAPEWELENIIVAPAARQKGIASRLLNALLASARATNSTAVFLEVRESNAAARSLYEKAGFVQNGRRRSYYASPSEDAILYRRSLV